MKICILQMYSDIDGCSVGIKPVSCQSCLNYWLFFLAFLYGFIDSTGSRYDGKQEERERERKRGTDMQQRTQGWDSNPGPLQRGQSLCTWDACSINWTKQRPKLPAILWKIWAEITASFFAFVDLLLMLFFGKSTSWFSPCCSLFVRWE